MWSRRAFLRATGALGTSVIAARPSLASVTAASAAVADRSADEVAQFANAYAAHLDQEERLLSAATARILGLRSGFSVL